MGSTETTQQIMFSLIEQWNKGGQTQQGFCKEKNLGYNKFQYWFRKYRAIHFPTDGNDRKFFKQIKLKDQPPLGGAMELVLPDGRKLVFHQPVEASFLRALLS